MYEVELKVRADHETVRQRLETLGATREARVHQVDTYYDAPHRDFAETDEALRIRRESVIDTDSTRARQSDDKPDESETDGLSQSTGPNLSGQSTLTYKGPLVDETTKTREEWELEVADATTLDQVLHELGFTAVARVEKDRTRYRVEEYTITLDTVADLGEFVEIEGEAVASAVESVRAGAFSLLEQLHLDPADGIRTSYLELLLANGEDM